MNASNTKSAAPSSANTGRITQADLARLIGVSQMTVHRALSGHQYVDSDLRKKVQRVADKHGYRVNAAARSMRTQRTNQVGILIRNDANEARRFQYLEKFEMILGINARLESDGVVATLIRLGDVDREPETTPKIFREHLLDGVIVVSDVPTEVNRRIEELATHCVWLDASYWREHDCLRRDEYGAGRLFAQQAHRAGYRRIVYYAPPLSDPFYPYAAIDRRRAVEETAAELGLTVHVIDWPNSELIQQPERLGPWLEPTTVVAGWNANTTVLLGNAAQMNRKLAGVDFGLASIDGTQEIEKSWPWLSRGWINRYDMGVAAAEMALGKLAHQHAAPADSQIFTPRWIEGRTMPGPHHSP